MVQTSFGFSGRFWPIRRPLFHGSRRGAGTEMSVAMVVSIEADPCHPSATSPSTGRHSLPERARSRRRQPFVVSEDLSAS